MTDVIAAGLLSGARDADELRRVHTIIDTGQFYPVRPLLDCELAAELYRRCRRAGATPRSLAACLVAAAALARRGRDGGEHHLRLGPCLGAGAIAVVLDHVLHVRESSGEFDPEEAFAVRRMCLAGCEAIRLLHAAGG
jgi:hypothetical protein